MAPARNRSCCFRSCRHRYSPRPVRPGCSCYCGNRATANYFIVEDETSSTNVGLIDEGNNASRSLIQREFDPLSTRPHNYNIDLFGHANILRHYGTRANDDAGIIGQPNPGRLGADNPLNQTNNQRPPQPRQRPVSSCMSDHAIAQLLVHEDESELEHEDFLLALQLQEQKNHKQETEGQPAHTEAITQPRDCMICGETLEASLFPIEPPSTDCTHDEVLVCRGCVTTWVNTKRAQDQLHTIRCPQCATLLQRADIHRALE